MFANTKNVKKIVITGNVKITKATMKSLKNPKKVTLYVDQKRVAQLQKTLPCKVRAIASKKTVKGSLLINKSSEKSSKIQSKKKTEEGVIVNKSLDGKMIEDNQGLVYELDKDGYYITKFDQKYDEKFNPIHTDITIPQEINNTSVVGVAAIIFGSHVAVEAASAIARIFGISERFIGLTIVAFGTSLPELVTSVAAARRGNSDIAVGNIVGSNLFNIMFVVGITAVIVPVVYQPTFRVDSIVAVAAAVLLPVCVYRGRVLKRRHGLLMLACYGGYFAYLLLA